MATSGAARVGTPTAPRVSTKLSDAAAGAARSPAEGAPTHDLLSVDFTRTDAPPPAESDTPAEAAPDVAEATTPGQTCSTGDGTVDALVAEASARYGVDPCFIVAVMNAESSYARFAVSPKGACGYMQLMPDTARRFGVTNIFDPRQNIYAGTEYLRFLLDRFGGNMQLALAGYNAGENAVEQCGNRIPPFLETQNYVRIITARYMNRHAGLATATAAPASPPSPDHPPVADKLLVDFGAPKK